MTKSSALALWILGSLASSWAYAGALQIGSSDVTFVAVGKPGFLKINGKGGTLTGNLSRSGRDLTGEVHVAVDKFVTGIELRDDHMKKKYFEVEKYPEAVLKIVKLEVKEGSSNKDLPFKGVLRFHGEEKNIEGTADITVDKTLYAIEARFNMQLSDYKIDVPSYAGVKVADKVDVVANFKAEEKP